MTFQCLEALQPCAAPGAAELAEILTRYELEGLLNAHDVLAKRLPGPTPPPMPSPPAEETLPVAPAYGDDNIRIVKIEKTNEPLVSARESTRINPSFKTIFFRYIFCVVTSKWLLYLTNYLCCRVCRVLRCGTRGRQS